MLDDVVKLYKCNRKLKTKEHAPAILSLQSENISSTHNEINAIILFP
jgi:hypothetical protein